MKNFLFGMIVGLVISLSFSIVVYYETVYKYKQKIAKIENELKNIKQISSKVIYYYGKISKDSTIKNGRKN